MFNNIFRNEKRTLKTTKMRLNSQKCEHDDSRALLKHIETQELMWIRHYHFFSGIPTKYS